VSEDIFVWPGPPYTLIDSSLAFLGQVVAFKILPGFPWRIRVQVNESVRIPVQRYFNPGGSSLRKKIRVDRIVREKFCVVIAEKWNGLRQSASGLPLVVSRLYEKEKSDCEKFCFKFDRLGYLFFLVFWFPRLVAKRRNEYNQVTASAGVNSHSLSDHAKKKSYSLEPGIPPAHRCSPRLLLRQVCLARYAHQFSATL
jgi:hypothetical protein